MIPKLGQHVKCILRNGAMAEGIVQSDWMNNIVQLLSLDGESVIIIPHPHEDIMLIKVMLEPEKSMAQKIADKIRAKSFEADKTELEQKFEAAHEATDPHDIDAVKSLAELKVELNKQERQIIAEKLKSHHVGNPGRTKYGYPGLIKKPSPK